MAESSEPPILEDYLLAEDAPLLEEMAEEDEEIDLYNEMTFGLDRDSVDEEVAKALAPPDKGPELSPVGKNEVAAVEEEKEKEEDKATEQQGQEAEEEQPVVEEMEEAGEDGKAGPGAEHDDYADMEEDSLDSAVLDSRIGSTWGEFEGDDVVRACSPPPPAQPAPVPGPGVG
nr:protein PAT1 homolog 2-like [Pelodiscus sinensis]|eukprot:XP_025042990.1 protein PAT1 homolog 2-like [Pelodiscus sinensis]